jgi:hypothetical protein
VNLRTYFNKTKGTGVLSTANGDGIVNSAIYAKPHFFDTEGDETVAFIMRPRQSRTNVNMNPHASFLFIEDRGGYKGKRLSLTMVREESDREKISSIRRRNLPAQCEADAADSRLVFFKVNNIRPLVGT